MLKDYENVQPIAYKILSNTISNNHFNHAYLFETNGYEDGFNMAISFAKEILKVDSNVDVNNILELKIIHPDGLQIKKEQLIDLQEEFTKNQL